MLRKTIFAKATVFAAALCYSPFGYSQGTSPDLIGLRKSITQYNHGGTHSTPIGQDRLNTITTAVPILTVSPDARSAALGDAGVAISPDANTSHWNVGKLGFVQNNIGVSMSYSPWLRNIVNDMSLSYLSGYKKVGENSAFSASMMYFDLGTIQFTDVNGQSLGDYNPKEYTFNIAYGLRLSEFFGIGLGAKFIHSNLTGNINSGGTTTEEPRPGNTGALDFGMYYNRDLVVGARDLNVAFGANLSNLGPKVSYTVANSRDFLPTNLRLGTALTLDLDPYNSITLTVDGNKLLVPTPQPDGSERDLSVLGGLFSSFRDAPGGASEELQEINISTGIEYWYDQLFAVRAGYFYESPMKGNRQYFSFGFGIRYQKFGLDGAYILPNEQNNPLSQTFRISLVFNLEGDDSATAPTSLNR
ncbi:type IX secretion system outer membrane channel protein PorV [soil metagenome]|jgi:hypothetical protein